MLSSSKVLASKQDLLEVFDGFRSELDEHNDRRERLIKTSRDITNLSKKLIFLLHRLSTDETDLQSLVNQSTKKLHEIQRLFAGQKTDLVGDRFWRYQRAVSPGLQEYIEALSFAYYLEHDMLITWQQTQDTLSDKFGLFFPLPVEEYLLGISDLTGELMRYAISAIPRKGGRNTAQRVCIFVRQIKTEFESLTHYSRELGKKQHVTVQSLHKIEDVAYAVAIRCFEYDLPNEMLDDIISRTLGTAASSPPTIGYGGRKDEAEYGDFARYSHIHQIRLDLDLTENSTIYLLNNQTILNIMNAQFQPDEYMLMSISRSFEIDKSLELIKKKYSRTRLLFLVNAPTPDPGLYPLVMNYHLQATHRCSVCLCLSRLSENRWRAIVDG